MERTQCSTDSDYDTDDLIEDARNFVITAKRYSCHKWFSKNFIVTVSFGAAHIYVIPDQLTLTSMQSSLDFSAANWSTCQTGLISTRRDGRGDKRERKRDEKEQGAEVKPRGITPYYIHLALVPWSNQTK